MSRLRPAVTPSLPAFVVMLGQLIAAEPACGQETQASRAAPESTTVVAGPNYGASGVHRWLFGEHYRTLWTTPIRVEVLDLGTFAGGLQPVKQGGGLQTQSLRFVGMPTGGSTPSARSTRMPRRSCRPTSGGRSPRRSPRTRSAPPTRRVPPWPPRSPRPRASCTATRNSSTCPTTPAWASSAREFAGVLGFIEERPDENKDPSLAFAGALEIVSTDELYDIIEKKPGNYVDSEQFLRARLLDVFLGDWDRHRDQWRWAKVKDGDAASSGYRSRGIATRPSSCSTASFPGSRGRLFRNWSSSARSTAPPSAPPGTAATSTAAS